MAVEWHVGRVPHVHDLAGAVATLNKVCLHSVRTSLKLRFCSGAHASVQYAHAIACRDVAPDAARAHGNEYWEESLG